MAPDVLDLVIIETLRMLSLRSQRKTIILYTSELADADPRFSFKTVVFSIQCVFTNALPVPTVTVRPSPAVTTNISPIVWNMPSETSPLKYIVISSALYFLSPLTLLKYPYFIAIIYTLHSSNVGTLVFPLVE